MTTPDEAIARLRAAATPENAAGMADYHKAPREYLGCAMPDLDPLVKSWRTDASVEERIALAAGLWDSNIHEAMIAASKLLTQARIPDHEEEVWQEFLRWVPAFDAWAIADHACNVGSRRLTAHPHRIETVEAWTTSPDKWTRRAALVVTLPYAKLTHPGPEDRAIRARILTWAEAYVPDPDWFIQKSIAWWLRTLSVREPQTVLDFIAGPGQGMKAFARKDAVRKISAKGSN